MELTDYLMYVVVWILGAVWGWYARERHAERKLDNFFSKLDAAVEEKVAENMIRISIEKHKDVFYVYNKENNDFMGQASSKQELEKVLAERYPNKRFMADATNLKEVGF